MNFPDFQQNSKFPWLILKFPDFSLTSGNPAIDYSKRFKSQKDDHMWGLKIYAVSETTRQAGLVRCSHYSLLASPYESKLASG